MALGVGQEALHLEAVLPLGDVAEVDGQAAVPRRVRLDLEPSVPRLVMVLELDAHLLGDRPAEFPLERACPPSPGRAPSGRGRASRSRGRPLIRSASAFM